MTLDILQDLRSVLGPVRDQGRRPTCLSFAASAVHEQARGDLDPLCVEWLFYHAAQRAGTGPGEGTTMPDTRQVLAGSRATPRADLALQRAAPNRHRMAASGRGCLCSFGARRMAAARTSRRFGNCWIAASRSSSPSLSRAPSPRRQQWLRTGTEIILPDDGEPIDRQLGHAVVAVGHARFGSDDLILVRNSWGPAWGADGHAWVRETYLSRRLFGGFSISEGDGDVLQSDAGGINARARVG